MKRAKVALLVLLAFLSLSFFLVVLYQKMEQKHKIFISTNPWVGYTPMAYIHEKDWLRGSGIEFIWLSDLSDNVRLYERDFTQGFLSTQYELLNFTHKDDIVPIFLVDRSDGADVITSNYTLDELRDYGYAIDVYLEQGSINRNLFEAFVKEYHLETLEFKLIESDQREIAMLKNTKTPQIAISYHPYASTLYKNGFKNIVSTKDLKTFFAIDALFINEEVYLENKQSIEKLKELFALALTQLKNDPKEFYNTVEPYLEGESYEEFLNSLKLIKWLHDKPAKDEIEYLKRQNINTIRLIR